MPVFIALILIVILGTAYSLNKRKQKGINSTPQAQDYSHFQSAKEQLSHYIKNGSKEYRVLGTLDSSTCDRCGNMDLKVFPVDKAVIGKNFPPFHNGCRCTTITSSNIKISNGKRAARDPITNRIIYVPDTMSYSEYKDRFLNK